jgi:hypothetical protein
MPSPVSNKIATQVDLEAGFNETYDQQLDFVASDNETPYDVSDWSFMFKVYNGKQAVITLQDGFGFTVLYGSRILFNHLIELAPGCNYTYVLQGTNDVTSAVKKFMYGNFIVS